MEVKHEFQSMTAIVALEYGTVSAPKSCQGPQVNSEVLLGHHEIVSGPKPLLAPLNCRPVTTNIRTAKMFCLQVYMGKVQSACLAQMYGVQEFVPDKAVFDVNKEVNDKLFGPKKYFLVAARLSS